MIYGKVKVVFKMGSFKEELDKELEDMGHGKALLRAGGSLAFVWLQAYTIIGILFERKSMKLCKKKIRYESECLLRKCK